MKTISIAVMTVLIFLAEACVEGAGARNAVSRSDFIKEFQNLFTMSDKDSDGFLDKLEYAAIYKAPPEIEPSDFDLELDFSKSDVSGDGVLSMEEFILDEVKTFDCLDLNHDQIITDDEIGESLDSCQYQQRLSLR